MNKRIKMKTNPVRKAMYHTGKKMSKYFRNKFGDHVTVRVTFTPPSDKKE